MISIFSLWTEAACVDPFLFYRTVSGCFFKKCPAPQRHSVKAEMSFSRLFHESCPPPHPQLCYFIFILSFFFWPLEMGLRALGRQLDFTAGGLHRTWPAPLKPARQTVGFERPAGCRPPGATSQDGLEECMLLFCKGKPNFTPSPGCANSVARCRWPSKGWEVASFVKC